MLSRPSFRRSPPPLPLLVALLAVAACAGPAVRGGGPGPAPADTAPAEASAGRLPEVPAVDGPLRIRVAYPAAGGAIDARDSTFIFGSAGTGAAALTVNGRPAEVAANGAWIAWAPLAAAPGDTLVRFDIVARTGADSARVVHVVRRASRFAPPPGRAAWIDTTTLSPRGRVWLPADEYLPLSVRAAPGATLHLHLADGTRIPLAAAPELDEVAWGIRAFDRDTANLRRELRRDRYAGVLRGRGAGASPGAVLPGLPVPPSTLPPALDTLAAYAADTLAPVLEAVVGTDTARARWPLQLALLDTLPVTVELDDDPGGRGGTDSITIGRTTPGGTYTWFFPTGTRAVVTGRVNGDLRVRLSHGAHAWVPAGDARALPPARPAHAAVVGSLTLSPRDDRVVLRVPLSERIPVHVRETDAGLAVRLYGAVSDVNWIRYGAADPLVARATWWQAAADEVEVEIALTRPVWGWRTRWERGDLLVEIRRPPAIDPGDPLEGRLIVVDPGHPPGGATGPTGLREAEANLGVALRLRELLQEAGARVVMTRVSDTAIDLLPRTRFAERLDPELMVSIHNNALPDGVNPLVNNGTSVYFNHPQSIELARAVQAALVRRLGLRDLGVGRGDLALVRPTWMPAILTEGLFMMIPAQEAALRGAEGRELYARGVFEGLRDFLAARARERP